MDKCYMTEEILNLTLEVIYLLAKESPSVKSADHMTITLPTLQILLTKRINLQKIIKVIQKMIDLLSEEVSGAGNSGGLLWDLSEW
ncbi:TPA: hypothetical protein GDO54_018566 [Pyxicephalus adspersus]|uniref:Uncharacterized protein n=1 Tax=Pyxicephalus adspersus TaxID=30357 RepID=A0AAV2ZDJ0_PYXAD|nr:TPA: hypothetical protein GDO54_018566 [Pyxicephalus adspersus]